MGSVVDQVTARQDLCIEIRSRWPAASTSHGEIERLGLRLVEETEVFHLSFDGGMPAAELLDSIAGLLADPLTAEVAFETGGSDGLSVDVFPLPGVTDAEGETAEQALGLAGLHGVRCAAGRRYRFCDRVPPELRPQVERLVGNPVVHRFLWSDEREGEWHPREAPLPGGNTSETTQVAEVDLRGMTEGKLAALSLELGLALDLCEMLAIQAYFEEQHRPITDVELQSLAQTWSEHCSHKTFKATIDFIHDGRPETVEGLLDTCIAAPTRALNRPWVRSAFVDNAGIIAFDDRHDLSFKVETHNHPSALEPFGGANTGAGGVIRDILAVSAEPIANTDVLLFGPPDLPEELVPPGSFHPATTYREVVRGIADYGNNMGIPTAGGAVLFHAGYSANPLVYCGTLGIAPRGSHPTEPQPGDLVVVLGGRTGRDGLHGATMSSAGLDRESVDAAAVQIGNPIVEKTVRDVLPRLRDERLYHAITDCGAGGFCSAVGEMGGRIGVEVELAQAPLKYEGLAPWEIWLSEAQERMVLAVPPPHLARVLKLCAQHDVEVAVIGRFRDDAALVVRHHGRVVADLSMDFLHRGRPALRLRARWNSPVPSSYRGGDAPDAAKSLLALLRHPSIASKEEVIRQYDHEVGGATVLKPLAGNAGPSDAAVLRPVSGSWRGVAIAHGINPLYGEIDPHAMALAGVDEALRNLAAVGCPPDRVALLDNFCWGDVADPLELGALVRAAQGCRDAALAYGVPFISGKDSLYNATTHAGVTRSIPGTLLISAAGIVPDIRHTVTMDLKAAGSAIFLLGLTADELGGSHYLHLHGHDGGTVPLARPEETLPLMRRLTAAIEEGLVLSCHDLSEGGLAVAAAEMIVAGGLGLDLQIDAMPADALLSTEAALFSESTGRFLVEVAAEQEARFAAALGECPCARLGSTISLPVLVVRRGDETLVDLPLERLETAWRRL